jgi:NhaA family Na+:H+ antiporter
MTYPPKAPSALREFLQKESSGGIVLMLAAAAALAIANSPWADIYFSMLKTSMVGLTVTYWINDGLMALFFLLIGLEIKREVIVGQLSTWPRRILPGIAAAGGMVVPAAIYMVLNGSNTLRGWAIPTATDIAFALGLLALLGSRVPVTLKIFLTALAIIDDIGAVVIIALFYTTDIAQDWLAATVAVFVLLCILNRTSYMRLWAYLLLGAILWVFMLKAGVHAALAGIAVATTIPLRARGVASVNHEQSPLHLLEHNLHPWITYCVLPVFGFANAGVALGAVQWADLLHPVTLGITAGLFIGKSVGVFGFSFVAIRLKIADCPVGATLTQVLGIAFLCGVGFTMSLFIGGLAFETPDMTQSVKLGILCGSGLSALVGMTILRFASAKNI